MKIIRRIAESGQRIDNENDIGSPFTARANARTLSGFRPVSDTFAPASTSAHAAPRAAPPLPTISTDAFGNAISLDSGPETASASVLEPRHLPARRTTVLTAPIRFARSSTESR